MAGNERTPLLQTVPVAERVPRYPHRTLRRFCTISLSAGVIVVLVLFLLPVAFYPTPHWTDGAHARARWSDYGPWSSPYPHRQWPQSQGLEWEALQKLLLDTPNEEKVQEWSAYYTSGPHLAGKNLSQAIWTMERWQEFGVPDSKIVDYDIYVNYPEGHRLALLEDKKVKYEASLEEDVLEEDHTSGLKDRIPTFHGYSASGNVTAQYVYVNYGSYPDFEELVKAKVDLKGKIALVKYGGIFRGLKVKRAQELGMIGVVMYSDPGDDGDVTDENEVSTYPEGPARQESSVQRGSTQFLSIAPGDPTTPGYPSKPGVPRQDPKNSIPSIPSIPISYADALPLLKSLNGHGPPASNFSKYWHTGGLGYKGVEYNIGPSPPELTLNLVNEQKYVTTPMWNVIGIINGSIPDEVVVLGNHRDAWIAGGAGDPNSGSAALNEVVRSFGEAVKQGWKPARTIVFASWDGEEYGLLGSTEWVEEYIPWLNASAVAYLNVDVAASGPRFSTAASPLLNKLLYETTSVIPSANQSVPGQTIASLWSGDIRTMGSGSDFTAFQDFVGVPSVDMGFKGGKEDAVYHYHSNYDSFDWMKKYGDPGWHYHIAAARLWALFAAKVVETPLIPFNATDYAGGLGRYVESIAEKVGQVMQSERVTDTGSERAVDPATAATAASGVKTLQKAVDRLHAKTATFDAHAASLASQLDRSAPWWRWWEKVKLYYAVRRTNSIYKTLERHFIFDKGLDGRSWFKHVVFAPGLWTGYAGATFPGLVESIDAKDWENLERWVRIIEGCINDAGESLNVD